MSALLESLSPYLETGQPTVVRRAGAAGAADAGINPDSAVDRRLLQETLDTLPQELSDPDALKVAALEMLLRLMPTEYVAWVTVGADGKSQRDHERVTGASRSSNVARRHSGSRDSERERCRLSLRGRIREVSSLAMWRHECHTGRDGSHSAQPFHGQRGLSVDCIAIIADDETRVGRIHDDLHDGGGSGVGGTFGRLAGCEIRGQIGLRPGPAETGCGARGRRPGETSTDERRVAGRCRTWQTLSEIRKRRDSSPTVWQNRCPSPRGWRGQSLRN